MAIVYIFLFIIILGMVCVYFKIKNSRTKFVLDEINFTLEDIDGEPIIEKIGNRYFLSKNYLIEVVNGKIIHKVHRDNVLSLKICGGKYRVIELRYFIGERSDCNYQEIQISSFLNWDFSSIYNTFSFWRNNKL